MGNHVSVCGCGYEGVYVMVCCSKTGTTEFCITHIATREIKVNTSVRFRGSHEEIINRYPSPCVINIPPQIWPTVLQSISSSDTTQGLCGFNTSECTQAHTQAHVCTH